MSDDNSYVDNVLISLKRTYSKDEVVAALYKKVADLETERGGLRSEIEHLEHLLNEEKNKPLPSPDKQMNKFLQKKNGVIKKLQSENKKHRQDNSRLIHELLMERQKNR